MGNLLSIPSPSQNDVSGASGASGAITVTTKSNIILNPVYADPTLANNIIVNQQQLITNLQSAIGNESNVFVIDANPSTTKQLVSNFKNINPISDYYTPPFALENSNIKEINDYINGYNQSIALLEDPNQLNKMQFDTYMYLQNKKINDLQNAIATFPTNGNLVNQPIKAIKNYSTSGILNVEEYPDPKSKTQGATYIGNSAPAYPNYLIYGNNGCLQFNSSNANLPWGFQSCNSNNPLQRFNMSKINTLSDYNAKIPNNNQSYKINDTNSTNMGFYVVNPETDKKQCLMLNTDGLSITPCTMESTQRFKPYYHSINP